MTVVLPESEDMILEQAVAWFVQLDEGGLSPEDHADFQRWRAIPAHDHALARVERMWAEFGAVPAKARPVAVALPYSRRSMAVGLALAASLLLGLAVLLDLHMRLQADSRTAMGEVSTIQLPDGSSATLAGASALSVDFGAGQRTVRLLRGEALFKVAHDAERPFVVAASDGTAQALGTEFSVRRDGGDVTVTVLESKVRVACCSGQDLGVTLHPGQQARYSAMAGVGEVRAVAAADETAWTRGKLIFIDRPLGEVVDELNRYFPGRIVLADETLRRRTVSGVFATGDPLGALDGMEQSLDLSSTRFGDLLVLVHG